MPKVKKTKLDCDDSKYKALFMSSRDAVMTLEPPSWKFTTGNPAAIKMFKAKNEENFLSHEPWKLSPERQPDGQLSNDKAKEMIEKAMKEGVNFFRWTHKRINGEEFLADVLLSKVEYENKSFLFATVRDITEHKKEEENLLKSEQRFTTIFKYNPACTSLTSFSDGKFLDVNDSFLNLVGYKKDELVGKTSLDLNLWVSPTDRAGIISDLKKIGKSKRVETKWRKKTGEIIDVLVEAYIIDMNGEKYMLGITEDVTEKKKQEEKIREMEERYRYIVENSNDNIFLLNKENRYLSVNTTLAKSIGKKTQDIIGKTVVEVFPEPVANQMLKNVGIVFETGKPLTLEEKILIQNQEMYNSTSLSPIKDKEGKVIAVGGIVRDITNNKKNQEVLEKLNRLMVGRELEMIKLKKEIADLKNKKS